MGDRHHTWWPERPKIFLHDVSQKKLADPCQRPPVLTFGRKESE